MGKDCLVFLERERERERERKVFWFGGGGGVGGVGVGRVEKLLRIQAGRNIPRM